MRELVMIRETNSKEEGIQHSNIHALFNEKSTNIDTLLNSINEDYTADYKYLSLKHYITEIYVDNPEMLKAWKSSDNIIQHILAQIIFEIITGKISLEDLP
jgi:hypothetical protein